MQRKLWQTLMIKKKRSMVETGIRLIKLTEERTIAFKEEMQEIQLSGGIEYWYAETFAARAGYFFEHENKGGRQYATVGVGLRYSIFKFDLSYLIPTTKISTNPLAHTIRIGLMIEMLPEKN